MKRIISVFLAAVTLLCMLPCAAMAEVPVEHDAMLDMKMGDHILWEWGEEYLLCQAEWNSLLLEDESAQRFPDLAAALEKMNLDKLLAMQDEMAWMLPIAQDIANENMYCTSESKYYIQRSDDTMLSVREDVYAFTGGAHPNMGTLGINLDSESGEELKLSDVMTDTGRVLEIVSDMLNEKYSLEEFMEVDEAIGMLTEDELEWTMNYEGITFYFYPGLIAPYAAGQMKVTIWYDEYAELFNAKYYPTQGVSRVSAAEIPLFEAVEIDLVEGDGKRDEIMISAYMDMEGYAYEQYFIAVNAEALNVAERYSYQIVPYLLTVERGNSTDYYLYIQETSDNDYRTLSVFKLTEEGAQFSAEFPGNGFVSKWDMEREASYSDVFNNPADFKIAARLDMLGTMTGIHNCRLDESSGGFIAQESYYDVSDAEMQVVSTVEIEVIMLDTNEKAMMPAGTIFTFLRTDGNTYMDAQLGDGGECRISIGRDDYMNAVIKTSDGDKIEWECFEELFYAG